MGELALQEGDQRIVIPENAPLVTYVTRAQAVPGLASSRQGLARLMQRNPRAHVLLVGSDEVAYGAKRSDGLSWREWALKKWPMDPDRLHMLPALSYDNYLAVIRRSWVHVYWTVPFILSWSLMESLASGCCVVASPPRRLGMIEEAMKPATGRFLDPMLSPNRLIAYFRIRAAPATGLLARQQILEGGYDHRTCLQKQLELVDQLMAG